MLVHRYREVEKHRFGAVTLATNPWTGSAGQVLVHIYERLKNTDLKKKKMIPDVLDSSI